MFITLTCIAATLVGLLLYLFFAPFYLTVDSNLGLFRFRYRGIASVKLKIEDRVYIETEILGLKNRSALNLYKEKTGQKEKETKSGHQKKARPTISGAQLRAILKSFKINRCRISMDTGDMQWNGILYPVFYFLNSYTRKPIEINFIGKNEVVLEVQNSIARMSWALISSS